jgi:arylsulfatase A-like enzyme
MTPSTSRSGRSQVHWTARLWLTAMLLLGCDLAELGGGAMVAPDWPSHQSNRTGRPNVILIVLDTTRADRMSYNGYDRLTTPNIDNFVRDAVVYRNAHSVAPWTLPAHASMFTGLLPSQHWANWTPFSEPADMEYKDILNRSIELGRPEILLPYRLKKLGYTTLGFSSNAWVSRRTGFHVGFDGYYEMWAQSEKPRLAYRWLPPRLRTLGWLPWQTESLSEMDEGDAAIVLRQFNRHAIREGKLQEPFFLFFNFIDPHYPYSPPTLWRYLYSNDVKLAEDIARFQFDEMQMSAGTQPFDVSRFNPFYDAELNYLDFAVGHLLTQLRQHGFYRDSLIVIVSDHGEFIGEEGRFSHQFSVAEELLHIPLVIKYPGNEQAGVIVTDPRVSNLDVYETIVQMAGGTRVTPSDAPSQSLHDMERFDRSHSIAESFYSEAFLRQHLKWDTFNISANRVLRRVVYDQRGGRYEFEMRSGTNRLVSSAGVTTPEAMEEAHRYLTKHLEALSEDRPTPREDPIDDQTLERLRSLGYVE